MCDDAFTLYQAAKMELSALEKDELLCSAENRRYTSRANNEIWHSDVSDTEAVLNFPSRRQSLVQRAQKTVNRARQAANEYLDRTVDRLVLSDLELPDEESGNNSAHVNTTPEKPSKPDVPDQGTTARKRSRNATPHRRQSVQQPVTPGRYNLRRSSIAQAPGH